MISELKYPYNLIADVLGYDYIVRNMPDLLPSVEYAIALLDNEYEQDAIHYHYRDGMTVHEIAFKVDRCTQTVRNRLTKALRKLRHNSRCKYLRYGVEGASIRDVHNFAKRNFRKLSSHPIEVIDIDGKAYNELKVRNIHTLEQVVELGSDYFKNELRFDIVQMRCLNNSLVRNGLIEGEVYTV